MNTGPRFTQQELDILRSGLEAGLNYKVINARLGWTRSIHSLRQAARQRGWFRNGWGQQLTDTELDLIREGVKARLPQRAIAKRIGRSPSAVCINARKLAMAEAAAT